MKGPSKFYSSLGLLLVLNVLIKPLWILGIDRQVQNEVGTAAYGSYFSLLNFSIIFSFLLDWGITIYYNRQLAALQNEFSGKAGGILLLKLLFALAYAGIVCLIAVLSKIDNWPVLGAVIAIQVLSSFFIFFRGIITAQQWFQTDAWLSVLDKGMMILVCGSFLYFPFAGTLSIPTFLLIQVLCSLVAMIISVTLLLRNGFRFSFRNSLLPSKEILKAAFPYALIVLLMSLHYRLDGFLLQQLKDDNEAGLYAGAYRILDAGNMAGYLVASFLLPFVARQQHSIDTVRPVVLASRHLLILFSITVAIAVLFLAPWLQQVLYPNSDVAASDLLKWCLPALIGYSLVQVYGTVLAASGHVVAYCYITLIAVLLNALLNVWLIPVWGAKGSCMAALVSHGLCAAGLVFYAREKCGQTFHLRSLLLYIFIAAILFSSFYLFRQAGLNPVLQLVAAAMIVTALALALGLYKWDKWKLIFS